MQCNDESSGLLPESEILHLRVLSDQDLKMLFEVAFDPVATNMAVQLIDHISNNPNPHHLFRHGNAI
jgi:hypothetical protein